MHFLKAVLAFAAIASAAPTPQLSQLGVQSGSPLQSLFGRLSLPQDCSLDRFINSLDPYGFGRYGLRGRLRRFNLQPQDPFQRLLQALGIGFQDPITRLFNGLGVNDFNGDGFPGKRDVEGAEEDIEKRQTNRFPNPYNTFGIQPSNRLQDFFGKFYSLHIPIRMTSTVLLSMRCRQDQPRPSKLHLRPY
jgi:hypothetical protein